MALPWFILAISYFGHLEVVSSFFAVKTEMISSHTHTALCIGLIISS